MRTIINLCSPISLLILCLTLAPLSVSRADPALRGTWTFTGSMHDARQEHTATLLLDGRVLVVGGNNLQGSLHSAELYDPNTGQWSLTGSLHEGRVSHTATLLPDGRVLVTGGLDTDFPQRVLKSAELYEPVTGEYSQTGDMGAVREGHTATLLPDGKVLVVGGGGNVLYHQAELYDPDTGTWSFTGPLAQPIFLQTATLLQDGEVLIAGGILPSEVTQLAALYDEANGLWNQTGNLGQARYAHTATLLRDGSVLVVGGFNYDYGNRVLRTAELYDPLIATWIRTRSMHEARSAHTATLLSSGEVLVAGGGEPIPGTDSELYDPTSQTWSRTGALNVERRQHTATLLPDGRVLAAGGTHLRGWLASAELFDPNASQ
jgi:WD40 repeat protein